MLVLRHYEDLPDRGIAEMLSCREGISAVVGVTRSDLVADEHDTGGAPEEDGGLMNVENMLRDAMLAHDADIAIAPSLEIESHRAVRSRWRHPEPDRRDEAPLPESHSVPRNDQHCPI